MARNATCSPVSSHEARAPDAGREGEAHLAWAVPWGAGRPFLMHPQSQSQGKAEHQLRTPHLLTESHVSQPFGAVQKVGAANPMSVIQEGEKKNGTKFINKKIKFSKSALSNFRSHFKTFHVLSFSHASTNATGNSDTVFTNRIPHGSQQSGKEETARNT